MSTVSLETENKWKMNLLHKISNLIHNFLIYKNSGRDCKFCGPYLLEDISTGADHSEYKTVPLLRMRTMHSLCCV